MARLPTELIDTALGVMDTFEKGDRLRIIRGRLESIAPSLYTLGTEPVEQDDFIRGAGCFRNHDERLLNQQRRRLDDIVEDCERDAEKSGRFCLL